MYSAEFETKGATSQKGVQAYPSENPNGNQQGLHQSKNAKNQDYLSTQQRIPTAPSSTRNKIGGLNNKSQIQQQLYQQTSNSNSSPAYREKILHQNINGTSDRLYSHIPTSAKNAVYSNKNDTYSNIKADKLPGKPVSTPKKALQKTFDAGYVATSPGKKSLFELSPQSKSLLKQSSQVSLAPQRYNIQEDPALAKTLERIEGFDVLSYLDFPFLDKSYSAFLEYLKEIPEVEHSSPDELISLVCQELRNAYEELRAGAALYLFEILSAQAERVSYDQSSFILAQIFENLPVYHQAEEIPIMVVCIEIVSFIGPHSISFSNLKVLASILAIDSRPILQEKAFQALQHLDYPGLQALLELTTREYNDLPLFVLNKLAQCPEIQASIIVPALINELASVDAKRRLNALAALNRMSGAIARGGAVPSLVNLMLEGALDRNLIASTLLAAGELGEQALLKLLESSQNPKIRAAVCGAFAWRISSYDKIKAKIIVIPYQVSQQYQRSPGTLCSYFGSLRPLSLVEIEDGPLTDIQDVIEVNTRDFTAALQRLLALKYRHFSLKEGEFGDANLDTTTLAEYTAHQLLTQQVEKQPEQPAQIPPQIIQALVITSTDEVPAVREAAVNSLGIIGLPEASLGLDALIKGLYDQDPQVRATSAWAVGKFLNLATSKSHKRLIELLKDNLWKVRAASCIALGYVGNSKDPLLYQSLVRVLRDGTINRLTVCETLVRLGPEGEQVLLDILRNTPKSNSVLKVAIIESLVLADVRKPTIDFVIEELFRNAGDQMPQVRKACLTTLEQLRAKTQGGENIAYLRAETVLPLFYFFLQDPSHVIREMAANSIYSFGPQGELMLIEGLTRDKNPIIRAECAKGLALFGPHTFRIIIFGLEDPEEAVRNATSAAIQRNFTIQGIVDEIKDKEKQLPSILSSLKEILNSQELYFEGKEYVREIYYALQSLQSITMIESLAASSSMKKQNIDNSELPLQTKEVAEDTA